MICFKMIYLSLGTNCGDKNANIVMARRLLKERLKLNDPGCFLIGTEEIVTEAEGFDGDDFINQVVSFESDAFQDEDGAERLLDICQQIEVEMGRPVHKAEYKEDGSRKYCSRIIDIDILKYNDMNISTERLTVPHPQIEQRKFVKKLLNSDFRNKY